MHEEKHQVVLLIVTQKGWKVQLKCSSAIYGNKCGKKCPLSVNDTKRIQWILMEGQNTWKNMNSKKTYLIMFYLWNLPSYVSLFKSYLRVVVFLVRNYQIIIPLKRKTCWTQLFAMEVWFMSCELFFYDVNASLNDVRLMLVLAGLPILFFFSRQIWLHTSCRLWPPCKINQEIFIYQYNHLDQLIWTE